MSGKAISARKRQHRNMILDIIRMEPFASRSSIKTLSKLSMDTVLQNVDKLLRENLIYESGTGGAPVGRKATWLSINPSGRYFIGVKFSSIVFSAVTLDFSGKSVNQISIALEADISAAKLMDLMMATIQDMLDALGDKRASVCGIGVGAPGLVDSQAGVLVRYAGIQGMNNIPIKRMIEAETGLPAYIDHTLKVTALAHKMRRENLSISNMLYVLVKSGVGMVSILNNKIYPGDSNSAGEIGHLQVVREGGRLCRCGRYGCLESEISYQAILSKMEEGIRRGGFSVYRAHANATPDAPLTINDFIAAFEMDDPDARAIYDEAIRLLCEAIVHAIVMLNPQKIIFAGELTVLPGFVDAMRREIWERCPIEASSHVQLEASNYDDIFDAVGAAFLTMHEEYGTWGDAFQHAEV